MSTTASQRRLPPYLLTAVLFAAASLAAAGVQAGERVTVQRDGRTVHLLGRVIVEAQDGGLLLVADDGHLWAIQPEELVRRAVADTPFRMLGREELSRRLLAELPPGFEIHTTAHYVIAYNTSRAYAQWCGALYERLLRGYYTYWERKGVSLREPEMPLVALVFQDKRSYAEYSRPELGDAAGSILAYYSLTTNRVAMYDLTGLDELNPARGGRLTTSAQINQLLSAPQAQQMVATIIHEATHQLAFNSGLHDRWTDVPMWVSEGIAVFFETPDLSTSRGWRTVGAVNRLRLARFRQYLARRPADSLESLVADDARFRTGETALDAYAETWALTYFLIRSRPAEYVKYLETIAAKPPLARDDREQRLRDFRAAFGELPALDAEFVRQMERIR